MKKLKFNSVLNHKKNLYSPCEISVERVVELGNNYFESLIKNGLKDDTLISKHKELMYIEGNTAHGWSGTGGIGLDLTEFTMEYT